MPKDPGRWFAVFYMFLSILGFQFGEVYDSITVKNPYNSVLKTVQTVFQTNIKVEVHSEKIQGLNEHIHSEHIKLNYR